MGIEISMLTEDGKKRPQPKPPGEFLLCTFINLLALLIFIRHIRVDGDCADHYKLDTMFLTSGTVQRLLTNASRDYSFFSRLIP